MYISAVRLELPQIKKDATDIHKYAIPNFL